MMGYRPLRERQLKRGMSLKSNLMDLINDLNKKFIDRQEKFIYYVVALSVACIGFSVYHTIGKPLVMTQIPLGVAILSWSISIFFGLQFLKLSNSLIIDDVESLHLDSGQHSYAGRDPAKIRIGKEFFDAERIKTGKILVRRFYFLEWGFYLGVLSFVAWHVLEMYCVAASLAK